MSSSGKRCVGWLEESNSGPSKDQGSCDVSPGQEPGQVLDVIGMVKSFDDMNLKEELLSGIYTYGLVKPSAIQQRAIMPCIQGHDVIVQAKSGTGKTATFSISVLQQISTSTSECQALILVPTRGLANQIQKVITALGNLLNAKCHACIGENNKFEDNSQLESDVHVVVGTPGRVYDMITRRVLSAHTIKLFVLDELDEMLSRGFRDQIHDVYKMLSADVQVILISATLPDDVLKISGCFMKDPVCIYARMDDLTLKGITQHFITIETDQRKLKILWDFCKVQSFPQFLIFCSTRRKVDWLAESLHDPDFPVAAMHSDYDQSQIKVIIEQFRTRSARILITTDLLARSIDVPSLFDLFSCVINFDMPNLENYIHRTGRGGRYAQGIAVNFVTEAEIPALEDIELYYHTSITEMPIYMYMHRDETDDDDDTEIYRSGDTEFYTSFHVSKRYVGALIRNQDEIERDTKTTIKMPREGLTNVLIYGLGPHNVRAATRRVNMILMDSRKFGKRTHFISIPMNSKDIVNNYNIFKKKVLRDVRNRGIDESMFTDSIKLHISLGVFRLIDKEESNLVSKLFREAKDKIIKPLLEKHMPIRIRVKTLSSMEDNPKKIHRLYGNVSVEGDSQDLLQKLADSFVDYFMERGFKITRNAHLKPYVTFINSKFERGPLNMYVANRSRPQRKLFNGSRILQKYSDYDFGVAELKNIHFSRRRPVDPEQYYKPIRIVTIL